MEEALFLVAFKEVCWLASCHSLTDCNIFSVLSITQNIECNPSKTNDKLVLDRFYPVISYRPVRKKKKATNCCIRSLWSANELPAQG